MKLIQDESERSKTIDTTLTQVWTTKGGNKATAKVMNSESDTNVDMYEYSKKIHLERGINIGDSSERRSVKSQSSNPPSTVHCSNSTVAASKDAHDSDESSAFVKKRKRRSTSQFSKTTTITPPKNKINSRTCDNCFRKDNKIADLRTKCAQLKGDRDALREKQLLVHRITSVDTEFVDSVSNDRDGSII